MDWYTKIKTYYDVGLWSIDWVKNAVAMGKITAADFETITRQNYVA